MKKRFLTFLAAVFLAALAGCSNKVDTAKVRAGLQSIDAGQKAQLEVALAAIDAGNYKEAVAPLKKIAFSAKLDKSQVDLLKDTMTRVQSHVDKGQ